MQEIAAGVGVLPITIANTYFVGAPGRSWFLVDTGTPGGTGKIQGAAEARYGKGARPEAILLTHGHPDHSGNAVALSDFWNVPVYAHRLELPFVQGKSKYPPSDPTVGGAMAMLTRAFPTTLIDLGSRVEALPDGGVVPGLPGWEWLPTPGHSPGHVSFFRAEDRTLLVGDALTTINMDSLVKMVSKKPEISPPPPHHLRLGRGTGLDRAASRAHPAGPRLRAWHTPERSEPGGRSAALRGHVHAPRSWPIRQQPRRDGRERHRVAAASCSRSVPH